MPSRFIRRIWLPQENNKKGDSRQKGVFTLLTAFIFLIFSTLGMSILFVTQIYVKLSGYKRNEILLDCAAENGLKKGFLQITLAAAGSSPPLLIDEQDYDLLLSDGFAGGTMAIEKCLGPGFPAFLSDEWDRMTWTCRTSCSLREMDESDGYFTAGYQITLSSEGEIQNFPSKKHKGLEASLDLLSGHIPLAAVPLVLEHSHNPEDGIIELCSPDSGLSLTGIIDREVPLLPHKSLAQVNAALHIKLFSVDSLTRPMLRQSLGLEISDLPVPEGVYLVHDDLGLGGVFVQGDIDELLLAIEDRMQVISFKQGDLKWLLKFAPEEFHTLFATPIETDQFDLLPRGIILINGSVLSLGTGIMTAGAGPVPTAEKIPGLLDGVRLTIVSPDEVAITSHLLHQRVEWRNDVPYLKYSRSQLNIFLSETGIIDSEIHSGRIIIPEDSPEDLKIQAALTASGNGIIIRGHQKSLHLEGSLHASKLQLNGNRIQVKPDIRFLELDNLLEDAPLTPAWVLFPAHLHVNQWIEDES